MNSLGYFNDSDVCFNGAETDRLTLSSSVNAQPDSLFVPADVRCSAASSSEDAPDNPPVETKPKEDKPGIKHYRNLFSSQAFVPPAHLPGLYSDKELSPIDEDNALAMSDSLEGLGFTHVPGVTHTIFFSSGHWRFVKGGKSDDSHLYDPGFTGFGNTIPSPSGDTGPFSFRGGSTQLDDAPEDPPKESMSHGDKGGVKHDCNQQ